MAALASPDDLKTYLRMDAGDASRDDVFSRVLDAASDWVRTRSRLDYDGQQARTERGLFRGPRTIRLRHIPVASVTEVRIGQAGQAVADMTLLETTEYDLLEPDTGRLHVARRMASTGVLNVTYNGGSVVTPQAREACVLAAAALADSAPQVAGGLSELKAFDILQRFERDIPPEAKRLVPVRAKTMWV